MLTRITGFMLFFLLLIFLFLSVHEINELIEDLRWNGGTSAPLLVSVLIGFLSPVSTQTLLASAALWSLVILLLPADKAPCMATSILIFMLAFILYAMTTILISPMLLLNGAAAVTPVQIVGTIAQWLGGIALLFDRWRALKPKKNYATN